MPSKEAVTSSDRVVAAVAANGLGITEALRTQGKAAGYGDAPIQAPKSWSDHLGTVTGFLLGAGNIAAQFNATNKGAAIAMKQIDGQVAIQQAQSAERVSIFDRFGATTTALGANVRDVGLGLARTWRTSVRCRQRSTQPMSPATTTRWLQAVARRRREPRQPACNARAVRAGLVCRQRPPKPNTGPTRADH